MLSSRKVENGLVSLECPIDSIGLPVKDGDEMYTLRELVKEYVFPKTTRKRVSETPKGFSTTSTGHKATNKCANMIFAYDVYVYDTNKTTISNEPKEDSILTLSFFEDISQKRNKSDPAINMQKYSSSDFKGYGLLLQEEKYPIIVLFVEKNEISEIFDLLNALIQNGNRVMVLTSQASKGNEKNYRLHSNAISLIIDKIQKEFTVEEFKKQIHLLAYKSSAFSACVYMSYKGVDTNLTSAAIFNSNIDELDVLASENFLQMDLSNSKLDSKIDRYRIKTPMLFLALNKTYEEFAQKYHKNRNPWVCRCTKFFDAKYFKDHTNNDWFIEDVIEWINAWKDFDVKDSFDADLREIDTNWVYIKQEGDDYSSDEDEDEREYFINEEFDDEYNFRINDTEDRILTREDLSESQKALEEKFGKLQKIIDKTLPGDVKLKFDNMDSYFLFLTYSLFLEELYAEKICTESYIKFESSSYCQLFVNTKKTFEDYVQEELYHLKKHAFARDQPIYIFDKADAELNWRKMPQFWIARVQTSSVCHFDEDGGVSITSTKTRANPDKTNQISMYNLKLYDWNTKGFPKNGNPSNFAFLPGSIVLGRVFSAMENISNPIFSNLVLSQKKIEPKQPKVPLKKFFSTLNDSQKEATDAAMVNDVTILKGPPGSGKTSSIYEMILQFLNDGVKPVMVVAASNLAVDNIAEKLIDDHADKILRVSSIVREKDYSIDHKLGSVCLHNKISKKLSTGIKEIEDRLKEDLKSIDDAEFSKYHDECNSIGEAIVRNAQVIFTTTASIGNKHIKQLESIPVIIMDESTQSSEPLNLIAMGVKGCTKLILVGDPEQLSVYTKVKTLQISLFERILINGVYTKPFMLDTQYRMHPDISEFPRKKFYNNLLKDGITTEDRIMKKNKYPLFFYDHQGIYAKEDKTFSIYGEDFGFSWSNKVEAKYVVEMVEILIRDRKMNPTDIGVMTAYSAQREVLVREFKKSSVVNPEKCHIEAIVDKEDLTKKQNITVIDINGLIVASCDAFQGREKKIIVMSMVRSNEEGNIGFMIDERRMNVALTRAQYSMILVGNAQCFSKNKLWNEYITFLNKKSYVHQNMYDY